MNLLHRARPPRAGNASVSHALDVFIDDRLFIPVSCHVILEFVRPIRQCS